MPEMLNKAEQKIGEGCSLYAYEI